MGRAGRRTGSRRDRPEQHRRRRDSGWLRPADHARRLRRRARAGDRQRRRGPSRAPATGGGRRWRRGGAGRQRVPLRDAAHRRRQAPPGRMRGAGPAHRPGRTHVMKAAELRWDEQPLIPVIVQDANTRQVLMTAFMNEAAYNRTLETGQAWFWSRRRQELWHKGATSGHFLNVRGLRFDCDGDAILLLVDPTGPACHTNATSCFFNEVLAPPDGRTAADTARELWDVIGRRLAELPEGSYVAKLARGGVDRLAKKIGEEATEVVIAAKNHDPAELTRE